MTLDESVRLFLADRVDRNCGTHALKSYSQHLTLLCNFLHNPATESITPDQLNSYLNYLRSRDLSPVTIRQRATAIRTFLKWCNQKHWVSNELIQDFHIPKRHRLLPKTIRIEEIKKLADTESLPTRDKAIIYLMLGAGLRRAEIADLTVDDINLDHHTAFVRNGKGGKQRFTVFADQTHDALAAWIQIRNTQAKTKALFTTKHGIALKPGGIYKAVCRAAQLAGVSIRPHQCRHTFATHYLDAGGNIHDLQELMGHELITTTMNYVSVSTERLRQRHQQLSLLDNLPRK